MSSGCKSRPPKAVAIADTIRRVPRGRVSTYGAIARAAGYPRNARYVGAVLRKMPGLPWQRILGSGGRIAVPRQNAFEQRFLLEAEGVRFKGRRVDLAAFEYRFARPAVKKAAKSAPKKRVKVPATLLRGKL